jgi:hypothetical protein
LVGDAMTKDRILSTEAGPELDALVAEKVMGLNLVDVTVIDGKGVHTAKGFLGESYVSLADGRTGRSAKQCPAYSTDIAHAWTVVEKFIGRGTQRLIINAGGYYSYSCHYEGTRGVAEAPTAPLAICRAALLAVTP